MLWLWFLKIIYWKELWRTGSDEPLLFSGMHDGVIFSANSHTNIRRKRPGIILNTIIEWLISLIIHANLFNRSHCMIPARPYLHLGFITIILSDHWLRSHDVFPLTVNYKKLSLQPVALFRACQHPSFVLESIF
jgi:hypothetical protein